MKIEVEIYIEEMCAEKRERAVKELFNFVALDVNHKPKPILGKFYL